jgi:hypothetical protein
MIFSTRCHDGMLSSRWGEQRVNRFVETTVSIFQREY